MLVDYVPYFVKSAVRIDGDRVRVSSHNETGDVRFSIRDLLKGSDGKSYFYYDSRRYSLDDDFEKIRKQRIAEMYY